MYGGSFAGGTVSLLSALATKAAMAGTSNPKNSFSFIFSVEVKPIVASSKSMSYRIFENIFGELLGVQRFLDLVTVSPDEGFVRENGFPRALPWAGLLPGFWP